MAVRGQRSGLSVLIVEDEALIAFDLAERIEELGHQVLGPYLTAASTIDALDRETPDFALLDVNLGAGENSLDVARHLEDRGVAFSFLTGYAGNGNGMLSEFPGAERLSKPCSSDALRQLIDQSAVRPEV